MHNRKQAVMFQQLVKSVREMTRKNFTEKNLMQIKCVFPQAFFFAWKKLIGKVGNKKEDFDLNIEANLNYKNSILIEYGATDEQEKKKGNIGPAMLTEREQIFKNSLLQMVKDQHR